MQHYCWDCKEMWECDRNPYCPCHGQLLNILFPPFPEIQCWACYEKGAWGIRDTIATSSETDTEPLMRPS